MLFVPNVIIIIVATSNIYTNHWEAPSKIVSVEDASLAGGGYVLKQNIWNSARDSISSWTGQELAECSLYGIRIYETGAVLVSCSHRRTNDNHVSLFAMVLT